MTDPQRLYDRRREKRPPPSKKLPSPWRRRMLPVVMDVPTDPRWSGSATEWETTDPGPSDPDSPLSRTATGFDLEPDDAPSTGKTPDLDTPS